MRRMLALSILLLAACERELTPEEQVRRDEHDIALVERANAARPPIERLNPEPLLYPDIERHDLHGPACNYAPGTSLGARVIAREADAFMKIDGKVVRFAADPGSRALPQGTRSVYNGREHVVQLQLDGETGAGAEPAGDYEGSVTVLDRYGRLVYQGAGLAQCRG